MHALAAFHYNHHTEMFSSREMERLSQGRKLQSMINFHLIWFGEEGEREEVCLVISPELGN